MLENLAEVFNTAANAFLEQQQDMGAHRLDYLLVGPNIVAFAKTLASNRKLANHHYIIRYWQIIGGTNQLLSPKDKQSRNLPKSALTLILAHYTYKTALLVPFFAIRAKDVTGANAANTVGILSKLFHTIDTRELLQMRPKPSWQSVMSRSGSHHVENETGTKQRNKGGAKRTKKQSRM